MPSLFNPTLTKILKKNKKLLEQTEIPLITVSATFKEDLKKFFGYPDDETTPDVVLSRAHFSMAVAVAVTAWGNKIDPKKCWIVEPTNYVSDKDWRTILFTEKIGKTLARHDFLKAIKDFIDMFGRKKLPIIDSITPPLLYLTQDLHKPILSFHIASGNILASQGKTIIQIITDPHVRYDYLVHADKANFFYCVFDDHTKTELQEKAAEEGHAIPDDRIAVTGPPIDPRILAVRKKKMPWRSGPLRLCITTGGLGTNKQEIIDLLKQLLPFLRQPSASLPPLQLLIYAGTHPDIAREVTELAEEYGVSLDALDDENGDLRVIHHPQIVDANELLLQYGFPWAHGFISKPSGDMAYDAAVSGSFLLTLAEWGEWEHNIREIFEQQSIAREAQVEHIIAQLEVLTSATVRGQSWVEKAMLSAQKLDPLFLHGSEKIIEAYARFSQK